MGPTGFYPAMVRSEPEYPDQVPRWKAYEAAHPGVSITPRDGYWEAFIPEPPDGSTVLIRYTLEALLDKLESLGADDEHPGV